MFGLALCFRALPNSLVLQRLAPHLGKLMPGGFAVFFLKKEYLRWAEPLAQRNGKPRLSH